VARVDSDPGRPSRLSSVHSHVAVGPVSRPIRTAPGAFDLTNEAIASGSESTTLSRKTNPAWFTTQIDVCFNLWGFRTGDNFVVVEGFEVDGNDALQTDWIADACFATNDETYGPEIRLTSG
jgi:hypothetical protein